MNLNKKILLFSLIFMLTLSVYGCSSQNKENTNTSTVTDSSTKESNNSNKNIDEGINKYYDDYLVLIKEKMPKELFEKLEKNVPVFKELNQKAKNACSKDYYVESVINNSREKDRKHEIKLKVSADGSSRQEEYKDGKLLYLNIYSKSEDTEYDYDLTTGKLTKTTNFSKKNNGTYPYQYGYFDVLGTNARNGDLKFIDYNGKKAVYVENTYEGTNKDNSPYKTINKYWFDAKTGIAIREEKEDYINGKLDSNYSIDYTIKFNQNFDKDTFIFDKAKLDK